MANRMKVGRVLSSVALMMWLPQQAHAEQGLQTVIGGAGNDYQVSVAIPAVSSASRVAVFERLDAAFNGDLWLTRSEDSGASWSKPVIAMASAANERHPSLIEASTGGWLLFHLSNAGGGYRIHRATSADGLTFSAHGEIDLGWPISGEVNPQVTRLLDGRLLLAYQRLGGAAFVALSTDDGANWDTLRTQVSPGGAALPRIAQKPGDGRLLLVYQTNPGNNQLQLWTRTSVDPLDWSDTPQLFASSGNNHDAWPLWSTAGEWQIYWTRVVDGSFQIHRSRSIDTALWQMPEQLSARPGRANVQPLALQGAQGTELYWGAAQVVGDSDYDIVRLTLALPILTVFVDGFESVQ